MTDTIRYLTDDCFDDSVLLHLMDQSAEDDGARLMQLYRNETMAVEPELDALCRRRMKKQFRMDRLRQMCKRFLRAAVCLVMVVLTSCALVLCFSAEVRAEMVRWITRTEDKAVTYSAAEQLPSPEEFLPYRIGKLPEDFQKQADTGIPGIEFYKDGNGKQFLFLYQPPDGSGKLYIIPGEDERLLVQVNGAAADLYVASEEGNESNIVWTDPQTGYLLMIKGLFSQEMLIELAESVTCAEESKNP